MIADSSSRLQRSGTGGSLATALRDRGPCVIPVQPNRSLPIRPAPPMPTRSASIVTSRKARSPILLKPSRPASGLDVVEVVQSEKSRALTNEFLPFGRQDGKSDDGMMLAGELIGRTDYVLPDVRTNVVQITQEINSVKRKSSDDRDREYEKEITKDVKKRRKSHEVDANHTRDERIENILKEYSRTYSSNLADKGERKSQHVVLGLWDGDKRCSPSVVVSTTEAEKTKEICNKVVPPLRLKKVVREASTIAEYHNVEVSAEPGNELNYRIVTGATPRPESPSGYSASFWSSMDAEGDVDGRQTLRDKNRRSSPKTSDGYKIKYRRNRLRQKLRELRGKALELSHEMAVRSNNGDTSPQCSTRLRQMMNCYEKQIENVSKLLCKLSASIPPSASNDVVDLDYENELDEEAERTAIDSGGVAAQVVNGLAASPSPPKLSPLSPIDYEKIKSPDRMRDSPPVLPRVYIAIQPTTLGFMKNFSAAKNWHGGGDRDDTSSTIEIGVKVLDDAERTIIRDGATTNEPALSPVSSFEDGPAEWDAEVLSPKLSDLKSPEVGEKVQVDTKTFDDGAGHRRSTPSNDFLLDATMNIEIDGGDTKEPADVQGCHLEEVVTQTAEIQAASGSAQAAREKQEDELERNRPSEALPSSGPVPEETEKNTEQASYDPVEQVNSEGRTVAPIVAQEVSTIVARPQVATSNVMSILQLQSNYYGSPVARDNVVFTGVIQNTRNAQKVTTSVSQSVALNPTMPLVFDQSGSAVSSSNQQCVVLPNSCNNEVAQESAGQRKEGNRIMTEQFPTLGNWVTRMSKKQPTKSKSKLPSGVTLPTVSTAEVARVPGVEAQKVRASVPSSVIRSNIVNVAPQWNTERWQRQQHQQRQQQLYAAAAASSAPPAVRPGICPPISVTQFYPSNYPIDPYGNGSAFGYHTMCPYGDYPYHSRLHTAAATAPPMSGYQIPLQDPSPLRQMQQLDKRFPAHLQDAATRHFATDLLKYPALSAAGNYQHTAAGLEFDRLRTATAATQQNGTTGASAACLPPPPPLLLPSPQPPAPLQTSAAQQTLARAPLAGYSSSASQLGRNRMIPDVVAAAAAAAVVAAASFGRQRGPLPPYGRPDADMVSGGIGAMIDSESTQLMANRAASRERLPEQVQSAGVAHPNSRMNNAGYHQLQNLILDRLPYVKTDDAYSQPVIYGENAGQEASSVSSSAYKANVALSSLITKEAVRKESRNCDTPHLGKVNRNLDTTSNLECSNCGLTGSMFKCLGCEAAFYCDERCQTRHWSIHVEKCPKRMPKLKKLI
ncbi:PREDICTED: uncharacterized protein LOC106746774 isoform X2 [Dinoponera quadriceps]|nr:PREDICTED: uncharacterized protein LOC106746774 isoform X2 [Dinoponera quadriceps]XP_014479266.1 PREDICTED: uncharacterized protein LOC106746774 isoform X2 [Dinoponera quadriceps]